MKIAISGIAIPNGLILTSSGIICIAKQKSNGEISIKSKKYPNYIKKIQKVGLFFIFLLAMIPDQSITTITTISTIVMPLFLLIIFLRFFPKLRILNYHGAEHKVVVAYINKIPLTLETVKSVPRVTKICGTMLVAPITFYTLLLSLSIMITENIWIQISLAIISLLLIVHYFLLRGEDIKYVYINKSFPFFKKKSFKLKTNILYKSFDSIGYFLQKYFTTKEPSDKEITVAILCMQQLIDEIK